MKTNELCSLQAPLKDRYEVQLSALVRLTERYCVVYQTLNQPPKMTMTHHIPAT